MRRGEVVEIDWHFTDMTGSKRRPAVIVQADFLNGIIDDTVLVKITSSRYGVPGTEVELDPIVESMSGLTKRCYASCKDIFTRDQTLINRRIGFLSDAAMRQIEGCLKQVLEIP